MYFRDYRHQIEPNEAKLNDLLAQAKERFFHNLSLLQFSLPELAERLKKYQGAEQTLVYDKFGTAQLLQHKGLSFRWPPAQWAQSLPEQPEFLPALQVVYLTDAGQQLIPWLIEQKCSQILLYAQDEATLIASLHACDWADLFKNKQLFIQLSWPQKPSPQAFQQQLSADLALLAQHGIQTHPFLNHFPLEKDRVGEKVWHFHQALQFNPATDPLLREHQHKFKWHKEFQLQNALIKQLKSKALPSLNQAEIHSAFPATLILVGYSAEIYQAAADLLPKQARVILLADTLNEQALMPFKEKNLQVFTCTGDFQQSVSAFLELLAQLPTSFRLNCRLYQAELSPQITLLRQRVEIELRYQLQPTFGLKRHLQAAISVQADSQYLLTRRTLWPHAQTSTHIGPYPVLLLGNGPSVVSTLQLIRSGQAQGYLWASCGTTLATLYQHGIQPHFHLELEMSSAIFSQLPEDYLQGIQLIAPLGFHAKQRALFGSHRSFIQEGHSFDQSVPALPDDTLIVKDAFPTVLNLAVELFAQLLKQTAVPALRQENQQVLRPEVWLAGFDLSFADIQQHHAQGSIYDNKEVQSYLNQSGELLETLNLLQQPVLTKQEFFLSAQQTKKIIANHPEVDFYQLSEGLDLGAKPHKQLPEGSLPAWDSSTQLLACEASQIQWRAYLKRVRLIEIMKGYLPQSMQPKQQLWVECLKQPRLTPRAAKQQREQMLLWSQNLRFNLAALNLRLQAQDPSLASFLCKTESVDIIQGLLTELEQLEQQVEGI